MKRKTILTVAAIASMLAAPLGLYAQCGQPDCRGGAGYCARANTCLTCFQFYLKYDCDGLICLVPGPCCSSDGSICNA